jgi:Zn-dependent M28 family amino/carboxypeptidase
MSTVKLSEVDQARYQRDLECITGARPPGSPHWRTVQNFCAKRLEALGYAVERHRYATGVNVVGKRLGTARADEQVLVSAHYDGVPDCPGADDNASGVAGALEVARLLATREHDRTLIVALWDEEELGLRGSQAYALRARMRGEAVRASYVFEMIGYRSDAAGSQRLPAGFDALFPQQAKQIRDNQHRGDFIAVVTDERAASRVAAAHLARVGRATGLPVVVLPLSEGQKRNPIFSDLRRSDHAALWLAEYPAIMITDTAEFRNTHYHCGEGPDTIDRLDAGFAALVIGAIASSAAELLKIDAEI